MLCGMIHKNIWRTVAERYHRNLPQSIREYLNGRGISNTAIDAHLIGWSGRRVTIPIFDGAGEIFGFRRGRAPDADPTTPKMISDLGDKPALYGAEILAKKPHQIVICEGEYDRLVLSSRGIDAVTSTAGARTFLRSWIPLFEGVTRIYICFDRDEAGEEGARVVQTLLPRSIVVRLPDAVGPSGDVTDYFVRLGKSRVDFDIMLAEAAARAEDERNAVLHQSAPPFVFRTRRTSDARAVRVKDRVPLDAIVSRLVDLTPTGGRLVGRCPFHEDRSPSFSLYPSTGTYYCFGCGAHGDVISFVMQERSFTYHEALDYLEGLDLADAA